MAYSEIITFEGVNEREVAEAVRRLYGFPDNSVIARPPMGTDSAKPMIVECLVPGSSPDQPSSVVFDVARHVNQGGYVYENGRWVDHPPRPAHTYDVTYLTDLTPKLQNELEEVIKVVHQENRWWRKLGGVFSRLIPESPLSAEELVRYKQIEDLTRPPLP